MLSILLGQFEVVEVIVACFVDKSKARKPGFSVMAKGSTRQHQKQRPSLEENNPQTNSATRTILKIIFSKLEGGNFFANNSTTYSQRQRGKEEALKCSCSYGEPTA